MPKSQFLKRAGSTSRLLPPLLSDPPVPRCLPSLCVFKCWSFVPLLPDRVDTCVRVLLCSLCAFFGVHLQRCDISESVGALPKLIFAMKSNKMQLMLIINKWLKTSYTSCLKPSWWTLAESNRTKTSASLLWVNSFKGLKHIDWSQSSDEHR